jgi:nucleoside-diphosphate-sugar epimerase
MKCLVTGGAGFIGVHLVDRLLRDGHDVVVLDDFSEGHWAHLPKSTHLDLHEASIAISLLDNVEDLFGGTDVIFHLAAYTRPQGSIVMPLYSNDVNVSGTLRILVNAAEWKVKRLVFASSASVYGEQEVYPSPETATPNPMSPYAVQKLIGEQYCRLFTKIYGLETNCLRFFNTYGSGMNPDSPYSSLIPKFIKRVRMGDRPTIYGTGEQRRDFVHVSDVVEALVLAAESEVYGEVFNVGSGWNYSVKQVFWRIRRMLDKNIEPIFGPAVIEPTQTLADITKIHNVLGWKPTMGLCRGLRESQWI